MKLTTTYTTGRITIEIYIKDKGEFECKAVPLVEDVTPWEIETELKAARDRFQMDSMKKQAKKGWFWWLLYPVIWYIFGWQALLGTVAVQFVICFAFGIYLGYKNSKNPVTFTFNSNI